MQEVELCFFGNALGFSEGRLRAVAVDSGITSRVRGSTDALNGWLLLPSQFHDPGLGKHLQHGRLRLRPYRMSGAMCLADTGSPGNQADIQADWAVYRFDYFKH